MTSEIQLREQLFRLLKGEVSLDEFEDRFAQESWNIHKGSDLGAQRLAYAVELRLAEHDSGHLPENELRRELDMLLNAPIIVSIGSSPEIQTSASMHITHSPTQAFRLVGTKSAVAFESQALH